MDVEHVSGWQSLDIIGPVAPAQENSVQLELIQSTNGKDRFSMCRDDIYFKAVASQ